MKGDFCWRKKSCTTLMWLRNPSVNTSSKHFKFLCFLVQPYISGGDLVFFQVITSHPQPGEWKHCKAAQRIGRLGRFELRKCVFFGFGLGTSTYLESNRLFKVDCNLKPTQSWPHLVIWFIFSENISKECCGSEKRNMGEGCQQANLTLHSLQNQLLNCYHTAKKYRCKGATLLSRCFVPPK